MVSRLESGKDTVQEGVESAAVHAGRIMSIVATAVRDVTREVGELATDVFELREARARAEADRVAAEPSPTQVPVDHVEPVAEREVPVEPAASVGGEVVED